MGSLTSDASYQRSTTLTRWEWKGLHSHFNLADGHAHQAPTPAQARVLARLSAIYGEADGRPQRDVEREFIAAFFRAAGQPGAHALGTEPLFHYSSSVTIEVIAHYLRERERPVALLTPTFDNISAILRHSGVDLVAIPERVALDAAAWGSTDALDAVGTLFLVLPNNPTGAVVDRAGFAALCEACARRGIVLVLDFSFRFFAADMSTFDQYALLTASGVSFIALEDTGKTWSALDLKVGFALASADVFERLQEITDDVLLNVSPFILTLLTRLIEEEPNPHPDDAARVSRRNRTVLADALRDHPIRVAEPESEISLAWMELPADWSGTELVEYAGRRGLGMLPGGPFFWHRAEAGSNYVRVALLRPLEYFAEAAQCLRAIVADFRRERGEP